MRSLLEGLRFRRFLLKRAALRRATRGPTPPLRGEDERALKKAALYDPRTRREFVRSSRAVRLFLRGSLPHFQSGL